MSFNTKTRESLGKKKRAFAFIVRCYILAGIFSPTACALIAACKGSHV